MLASLDSLVKNFSKDDFKYSNHKFYSDLVKLKRFYPYEYMSGFEKYKNIAKQRKVL